MSGGSEPTKVRGRCSHCTRTFTLRRSGPSNTALPLGTLYVPGHEAGPNDAAPCEGSRKPPADETAATPLSPLLEQAIASVERHIGPGHPGAAGGYLRETMAVEYEGRSPRGVGGFGWDGSSDRPAGRDR